MCKWGKTHYESCSSNYKNTFTVMCQSFLLTNSFNCLCIAPLSISIVWSCNNRQTTINLLYFFSSDELVMNKYHQVYSIWIFTFKFIFLFSSSNSALFFCRCFIWDSRAPTSVYNENYTKDNTIAVQTSEDHVSKSFGKYSNSSLFQRIRNKE